ncbi:MAG: GNAT family N-acetyltransferase [Hyphomicrobiaceae bacterium]
MNARPDIRAAGPGDLARLYDINQASTPGVGDVAADALAALIGTSAATLVAEADGKVAGFILCLTEGSDYRSLNYRWIAERYPRFAYCDRIAIAPEARGAGLGAALYQAAFDRFAGHRDALLCEVNLAPPNPGSLRFHDRLGFRAVGERWSDDRAKGVVYLERMLSPSAAESTSANR